MSFPPFGHAAHLLLIPRRNLFAVAARRIPIALSSILRIHYILSGMMPTC